METQKHKEWRQKNKDRVKDQAHDYYEANKVKIKNYWAERRAEVAVKALIRSHDASPEEVQKFYKDCEEQQGRCAICGEVGMRQGKPKLYYDHNHETGRYRGALCAQCNILLGAARDKIDILRKAEEYLGE